MYKKGILPEMVNLCNTGIVCGICYPMLLVHSKAQFLPFLIAALIFCHKRNGINRKDFLTNLEGKHEESCEFQGIEWYHEQQ